MGVNAYVVIGSGYGDEGKGLMTDYFCRKDVVFNKVLNIKVNGGAQAGHTVCEVDGRPSYNRFVFNSMGSGSFAGADTHLGQKFLVDPKHIIKELDNLDRLFDVHPNISIDPRCRIVLKADREFNRLLEATRSKRHGSCCLGIFEAVNRNHFGYALTISQINDCADSDELIMEIHKASKSYLDERINQLCEKESIDFNETEITNLYDNLWDYAKEDFEMAKKLLEDYPVTIQTLNDILLLGKYNQAVFECSQGLELDWRNPRNFPHTTGSHTGLTNVIKELNDIEDRTIFDRFEVCYVTRTYKTKHGDGEFYEADETIKETFSLYDRTNIPNSGQGTLRYGKLDIGRMSELINEDYKKLQDIEDTFACLLYKSIAVTHVDQTSESVLTSDKGEIYFTELNANLIYGGDRTYYSFGEKASDVIMMKC